jgi:hypothetical protein
MEADVILNRAISSEVEEDVHTPMKHTPAGRRIFQLLSNNPGAVQTLATIDDLFVSSKPLFYSAAAYLISRAGMEDLMRLFAQGSVFTFPGEFFVADKLLFHHTKTFTTTRS